MAIEPFYNITPGRQTSSKQAVFGVTVGTGQEWPKGCSLDYELDGEAGVLEVPDEQDHPTVYAVFHDVAVGVHTFHSVLHIPEQDDEDLGKFRWEIIEAAQQPGQGGAVNLEGTAHLKTGTEAEADASGEK